MAISLRKATALPKPGKPWRRKRVPPDALNSPTPQEVSESLAKARAKPDSVEKVIGLSSAALEMERSGNVALAYNTFGEAVRAARPLPLHAREDALSHVLSDFRQTAMHMDCYFSLLRLYKLGRS